MRYGELLVEKSKVDSEKIEVVIVKGAKYFSFTMNQSENTGMDVIRMIVKTQIGLTLFKRVVKSADDYGTL